MLINKHKKGMKKNILVLMAIAMLAGCSSNATPSETPATSAQPESTSQPVANVDTFTSASTGKYFYQESALQDDALWEVIANYAAAPTIATVNPDGTPNLAVFMPGMPMELEGEHYFVFGLADNQTKLNLQEKKVGVLSLYQYNPSAEEKTQRNVGARLNFELVEDSAVIDALNAAYDNGIAETMMVCHVVEVLPLG